jgi:Fur family transcriptional regulator, peroxide stress response regulator
VKSSAPTPYSQTRRATKQRDAVLRVVEQVDTHPNADEVYRMVRKILPQISLATVYRNLHLLAEEGRLREVQFHGDVIRYDGITGPHEHFYCRKCGMVWDIHRSLPKNAVRSIERRMKSSVERYTLDYYGLCVKCAPEAYIHKESNRA